MAENQPRVMLVGHCGPDSFMLNSAVRRALPDAEIDSVATQKQLDTEQADLLIVNRVLDGSFPTSDGVELIRTIAANRNGDHPAMILVSNYPEARKEAEAAGALPGFGKNDLYDQDTTKRLQDALAAATGA